MAVTEPRILNCTDVLPLGSLLGPPGFQVVTAPEIPNFIMCLWLAYLCFSQKRYPRAHVAQACPSADGGVLF